MPEKIITDQIKQLGPRIILERYYLPDGHPSAKPTGVKYIGFQYPEYTGSYSPSEHFKLCQGNLDQFMANLSLAFPEAVVKKDLQNKTGFRDEVVCDESNTNPLFEKVKDRLKGLMELATLLPVLQPIAEKLSWSLLKQRHVFVENMNSITGKQGGFNPKNERLLVLSLREIGKITVSVTPNRYYQRFLSGVCLAYADGGMRLIGMYPLPVLVRLPHQSESGEISAMNWVIEAGTGLLERAFPTDYELNIRR